MGIRKIKTDQGMPIETLKPGTDPVAAINKLYSEGRRTYGQPNPDDYKRAPTPASKPIAKDESQPQFAEERTANHDDTREGWTRGYGSPHPRFDSGPSGSRYDKK
jgi:hypothetical protein